MGMGKAWILHPVMTKGTRCSTCRILSWQSRSPAPANAMSLPYRFPAFEWSAVGGLFLVSCAAAGAQELLVRGYGGAVLESWYAGLLAGTTDVYNPIYWGKVRRLPALLGLSPGGAERGRKG